MRALEQVHIDSRVWRCIDTVFMDIRNNANNRKQPDVTIHVPELNGLTNRILAGPALARKGCADYSNVRRIGAVTFVKCAAFEEGNSEGLKISISRDAKICCPKALFLAE